MDYQYNLAPVQQAFDDYVDTDIPHITGTFKLCSDYTTSRNSWEAYPDFRALTSTINWKSNVGGADMTHNLRTKLTTEINRGDYVYDPVTGSIGLVTYYVDKMVDCKKTQITECNLMITVERNVAETLDPSTGMVITPASIQTILPSTPCFYSSMYGRYTYEIANNTPGIFPDQKVEIRLQWNSETKEIRSGDVFTIRGMKHSVMFIDYEYINMDGEHGFIIMTCERR